MEDKPWKNELKKCEEALPRLKGDLKKASRLYKGKGVGCDGFHPKVPLDLTKETRGKVVEFLEKVEQSGRWPQQACTTMFFLTPKNVTIERPIALMPTLIRWWEALRAPEVRSGSRSGTLPTGEMEQLSAQCGKYWWKWRDLMEKEKE